MAEGAWREVRASSITEMSWRTRGGMLCPLVVIVSYGVCKLVLWCKFRAANAVVKCFYWQVCVIWSSSMSAGHETEVCPQV